MDALRRSNERLRGLVEEDLQLLAGVASKIPVPGNLVVIGTGGDVVLEFRQPIVVDTLLTKTGSIPIIKHWPSGLAVKKAVISTAAGIIVKGFAVTPRGSEHRLENDSILSLLGHPKVVAALQRGMVEVSTENPGDRRVVEEILAALQGLNEHTIHSFLRRIIGGQTPYGLEVWIESPASLVVEAVFSVLKLDSRCPSLNIKINGKYHGDGYIEYKAGRVSVYGTTPRPLIVETYTRMRHKLKHVANTVDTIVASYARGLLSILYTMV